MALLLGSVTLLATNLSDDFSTDTTSGWTARAGVIWVHDAANGEADLVVSNPRYGIQYNTTPGSTDHECQVSFRVGSSSSHGGVGGPAVRMRNNATKEWYYLAVYPRDTGTELQLLRRNDGTDSSGASSTQIGTSQSFTIADNDFITLRLAAVGTTLSVWWRNDGATKLSSDPGWIGVDGSPNYSQTDATYNSSTYDWGGLAGNSSGSDYDTQHDYFKCRAISDRGGGGGGSTPKTKLLMQGIGEFLHEDGLRF